MIDIVSQIKKNGSYATKTADENQQAEDLHDAGLINIAAGGSSTDGDDTIPIKICTATKKFKELQKKEII